MEKPIKASHVVEFVMQDMPPDSRGIPADVIANIAQSVFNAKNTRLREDREDPVHRWATVASNKDATPPAEISAAIVKEIMDPVKARQFANSRKSASPINENRWLRDWWIIYNWLTFSNQNQIFDGPEIGLCDLTDELASEIIGIRFTTTGFQVSAFRKFRREYGLQQVPESLKLAGRAIPKLNGETSIRIERFAHWKSF